MLALRRREINTLAERIRDALQLGRDAFPVDVEACIDALGGKLVRNDSPTEAMIQKDGDSFRITINRELYPTRERFSLAHELGHLFLHMGFCVDEEKWNSVDEYRDDPMLRFGYSEEEYEAHEFAGAFLMPGNAFRAEVAKHQTGGTIDVRPIAEHFGVSTEATRRRGQWLGLFSWDR